MKPAHHTFLYDGSCGICRKATIVGRALDWLGWVDFMDAAHDWASISKKFPRLKRDDCLADIHLVSADGTVFTRFAAYRRAMRAMPLFWPILPLLYVPPVPQVGDRIYNYVARHRHDQSCKLV